MRRRAGAEIALINRAFIKAAPFPLRGRPDARRSPPRVAVPRGAGCRPRGGRQRRYRARTGAGPGAARPWWVSAGGGGTLEVNGRALDKARGYDVATIAFIATGGDGILLPPAPPLARAARRRPTCVTWSRTFWPITPAIATAIRPSIQRTDFGRRWRPASAGGGARRSRVSTSPPPRSRTAPAYTDAQLVRASQLAANGNATGLAAGARRGSTRPTSGWI